MDERIRRFAITLTIDGLDERYGTFTMKVTMDDTLSYKRDLELFFKNIIEHVNQFKKG